ncbi:MAG: hypothetical protein AAF485_05470 [Chloroflexota bacterium]
MSAFILLILGRFSPRESLLSSPSTKGTPSSSADKHPLDESEDAPSFLASTMALLRQVDWRRFAAPILVGLVLIIIFIGRAGIDQTSETIDISSWNLSVAETATQLIIRTDIVTIALLLIVTLSLLSAAFSISFSPTATITERQLAGWLLLGSSASLLFVSGNQVTVAYAILIFDSLAAAYWLKNKQTALAIARLGLGLLTTSLLLATLLLSVTTSDMGQAVLLAVLFLRLGLYPFYEYLQSSISTPQLYWVITLTVGIYLMVILAGSDVTTASTRWTTVMHSLIIVLMLICGLVNWLSGQRLSLIPLILTQLLLLLLALPEASSSAVLYGVGLFLSFIVFRFAPENSEPSSASWSEIGQLIATLNLLGLPFFVGWSSRLVIYETLFVARDLGTVVGAVIAQIVALSGLIYYWLHWWRSSQRSVSLIPKAWGLYLPAAIPIVFLLPFLGPWLLSGTVLGDSTVASTSVALSIWGGIVVGAGILAYFREELLERLPIASEELMTQLSLPWLPKTVKVSGNQLGKRLLQINTLFEGQHYIGWALFVIIIGSLILSTGLS